MIVGTIRIELHIPGSTSLKAKRSVVNRIKERLKSRFNASVAEVDHHDLWQRAALGVAVVGVEKRVLEGQLSRIVRVVEGEERAEIIGLETTFH
ncbi:MAG: DUF503 domain-containing protein [Candidatus Eiseniibacteriota bacterium]|nr:MAG: DUF503 domain-containing protein [Candidatus Eisenbacteria bacterium]